MPWGAARMDHGTVLRGTQRMDHGHGMVPVPDCTDRGPRPRGILLQRTRNHHRHDLHHYHVSFVASSFLVVAVAVAVAPHVLHHDALTSDFHLPCCSFH